MGDFWFDAEGDGQGIPFAVVEIIDGEIMSIE